MYNRTLTLGKLKCDYYHDSPHVQRFVINTPDRSYTFYNRRMIVSIHDHRRIYAYYWSGQEQRWLLEGWRCRITDLAPDTKEDCSVTITNNTIKVNSTQPKSFSYDPTGLVRSIDLLKCFGPGIYDRLDRLGRSYDPEQLVRELRQHCERDVDGTRVLLEIIDAHRTEQKLEQLQIHNHMDVVIEISHL